MPTIPLTRDMVALVDDCDFDRISAFRWHVRPSCRTFYAERNYWVNGRSVFSSMHRMILGLSHGDGVLVDHVNRDGLDNRRSNLRQATASENAVNTSLSVRNTSGYRGVTWHTKSRRWQAAIHAGGQCVYLGLFSESYDAARAYDAAAKSMFGDFARTNLSEVVR